MGIKKTIAGLAAAGALAATLTAGPVVTADLGIGGVQPAEAYTTAGCHYHYSSFYGNERFCLIDWNWWEEVYHRRVDGWHVYSGGWIRTYQSHYHSGWV